MNTPAVLRPAAWGSRRRGIAAVVAVVVVVAAVLWWVLGADARREGAACDLFENQQAPLRDLLAQVEEASQASAAADDTTLLPYFANADSSLNTMRRWQSTEPRVSAALEGTDGTAAATFDALTVAVAELQRRVEADVPADAVAYLPDVRARLDAAAELCGEG